MKARGEAQMPTTLRTPGLLTGFLNRFPTDGSVTTQREPCRISVQLKTDDIRKARTRSEGQNESKGSRGLIPFLPDLVFITRGLPPRSLRRRVSSASVGTHVCPLREAGAAPPRSEAPGGHAPRQVPQRRRAARRGIFRRPGRTVQVIKRMFMFKN